MSGKVEMNATGRKYSDFANDIAKSALNKLLDPMGEASGYRCAMVELGEVLGEALNKVIGSKEACLVVSTAEDADFLSKGVIDTLSSHDHDTRMAVFWNNHYSIPNGSIAPIVNRYIQPGYENADALVVVKSVISGSCVVRTNILALIDQVKTKKIYILSPVMHINSKDALSSEFPEEISEKFEFIYFAEDEKKSSDGEVVPGIGGQIYERLDIKDQPAKTGYVPELVKRLIHA
ncbi:hypothetical protein [Aeromonas veronii]|uniref:hypothetical protein n=1 Tax=Aeromonas veronii TaxID=654 RepID=UPI003D1DC006